jgi:hypothetical protein
MNQTIYLVMVRCESDDIPLLLTDDWEQAERTAEDFYEDESDLEPALKLLSIDCSPLNTSIYTFTDGKFVAYRMIKDLTV